MEDLFVLEGVVGEGAVRENLMEVEERLKDLWEVEGLMEDDLMELKV